jgi:hypothetical protein
MWKYFKHVSHSFTSVDSVHEDVSLEMLIFSGLYPFSVRVKVLIALNRKRCERMWSGRKVPVFWRTLLPNLFGRLLYATFTENTMPPSRWR